MAIWANPGVGRRRALTPVQGAAVTYHFGRLLHLSHVGVARALGCRLESVRGWRSGKVRMSAVYVARMVYVLAMVTATPGYWQENRVQMIHWGAIERHKFGLASKRHPLFPPIGYGRHDLATREQSQTLVQHTLTLCGLSVADLARCLGTKHESVKLWLNGTRALQPFYLGKLLWLWLCRFRLPNYWDGARLRVEFGFPGIETHENGLGMPPRARRARDTAKAAKARALEGTFYYTLEEAARAAGRIV